ncbi:DUF481 domain-containing protein [Catenovulum sp. 2E275]|uniref:DUF481 domain-containing protein n=1 Tax=Catenovulum sp. 2E275 TaxID=2980497 RepID=UPI0021D27686|nr:DUF481 domain-containing protein [Catenovulum sp. 2E275]MCU4677453.1 DUF481 domain-containing protein [Catenovulum sp. 2E275]
MKSKLFLATACMLTTQAAHANKEQDKLGTFVASVEVGYIMTSSTNNNDTTSTIVKVDIGNETESLRNQFSFESLFKQDEVEIIESDGSKYKDKKTTKEKYSASVQTNFKVNDSGDAILAFLSYEADRFSDFHYQTSIATGYNTRVLDSKTGFLDLSIGPGYAFDSLKVYTNDQGQRVDGNGNLVYDDSGDVIYPKYDYEDRQQMIWRAAITYQRKIMENINFKSAYSIEEGDYNTKSIFETALTMQVNGSLSLKAAINNRKNTNEGVVTDDKRNTITLVYNF